MGFHLKKQELLRAGCFGSLLSILMFSIAPASAGSTTGDQPTLPTIPRPIHGVNPKLERVLAEQDRALEQRRKECWTESESLRDQGRWSAPGGYYFEVRYRVLISNGRLLSVAQDLEIFCGGAYPIQSTRTFAFDLRQGDVIDPLKLFRVKTDLNHLRPEIEKTVRKRLNDRLDRAQHRHGCKVIINEDAISGTTAQSVALSASGLIILLEPAHAVAYCYGSPPQVLLPYKTLRRYLDMDEAQRIGWLSH